MWLLNAPFHTAHLQLLREVWHNRGYFGKMMRVSVPFLLTYWFCLSVFRFWGGVSHLLLWRNVLWKCFVVAPALCSGAHRSMWLGWHVCIVLVEPKMSDYLDFKRLVCELSSSLLPTADSSDWLLLPYLVLLRPFPPCFWFRYSWHGWGSKLAWTRSGLSSNSLLRNLLKTPNPTSSGAAVLQDNVTPAPPVKCNQMQNRISTVQHFIGSVSNSRCHLFG